MTMCAARFVCPLLLTAIGAACQAPEAADPRAFDASTADASVTGSSWPSVNLWASASTGAGFVIAYTTQSPSPWPRHRGYPRNLEPEIGSGGSIATKCGTDIDATPNERIVGGGRCCVGQQRRKSSATGNPRTSSGQFCRFRKASKFHGRSGKAGKIFHP